MTLHIKEHKAAFAKAIANPDNINQDGSINWNFVDSDIWLDSNHKVGNHPTITSIKCLTNIKQNNQQGA